MTAPATPDALRPRVPPPLRSVIAVCAGIFVGALMIYFFERLGHLVVAPPANLDPADPASVRAAMAEMRVANFLMLLVAYLFGTTLGCWLTARMAPSRALAHAGVVGAMFLAGGISNFVKLPHPVWFVVASLLAFAVAPFLGTRMSGR